MKRIACKRCGHQHDCPKTMTYTERATVAANAKHAQALTPSKKPRKPKDS